MRSRLGVYICHCGTNVASKLDVQRLREFAAELDGVALARDYRFMCAEAGQELLAADIVENDLDAVVVAACSPQLHETTFRRACLRADLNPYLLEICNIREQCAWVTPEPDEAQQKARALLAGAVARARRLEPLEGSRVAVEPAVLVLGAGVAGIQAALDVADAGYRVYLVEREQSIGGHMAQFDKTFPTLDCAACILAPKMASVGNHPRIELLTYSRLERLEGFVGNFEATVRSRAKSIDTDRCNGCGLCIERCPIRVLSPFDQGMGKRKAIYVDFPQAMPNKPVVDREACAHFQRDACELCKQVCERDAIDFAQEDEARTLRVGAVIIATGFQLYAPQSLERRLGAQEPDVFTSLQLERMLSTSGPTGGRILRGDKRPPKSVAIAHCVGSRDVSHNAHCSRVCCMAALKYAHLIKEQLPDCEVSCFYIDMRCFGKGYEEFYARVQREGVHFIRGKIAEVRGGQPDGQLVVRAEDTLAGRVVEIPVEMVVQMNALVPRQDAAEVAQIIKCGRSSDGFVLERHPKLAPSHTALDGVFVAGAAQGPKDIPDSVAQGSAAAASALALLVSGEVQTEAAVAKQDSERCSGCRSCISICPYGAISLDREQDKAALNEALCKGCGTCAAACPSEAIVAGHYTRDQLRDQLRALLSG